MINAYIIPDPQHDYAVSLIETIKHNYGLRPIYIYNSRKYKVYNEGVVKVPEYQHEEYFLDVMPIEDIVKDIKSKYNIVGIVPYYEQCISDMTNLAEALQLSWNSVAVLRRFRNKSSLKDHLKINYPDINIGVSRAVNSAKDVFSETLPNKYVIKPNDGLGNKDIGFFDSSTSKKTIEKYFSGNSAGYILEEFFDGREYAVNGQMDNEGNAIVVNVIVYDRINGNNKQNLYHRTNHLRQTAPEFNDIATYATMVMQASGLKRCPFHMEIILTASGPRLIEVGARFGGMRYAYMSNDVHGNGFDCFKLAAHYYLFDSKHIDDKFNWEHYNKVSYVHVDGMYDKNDIVYSVKGSNTIEKLPEFKEWVIKPKIGSRVYRTMDIYTIPYSFHMMGFMPHDKLIEESNKAQRMLLINNKESSVARLVVSAMNVQKKIAKKVRWIVKS